MTDFTGAPCPVCKKNFFKDDRPVICPDCGAPYHRDCYSQKGSCVFSDAHKSGFVWERPVSAEPPSEPMNSAEAKLLSEIIDIFENKQALSPEERFIFGVSEKELIFFQGGINPLRLTRYRKIASGQKISFNVFAGLLSPYYMFYSRMRVAGAVFSLISFLLALPGTLNIYFSVFGGVSPFTTEELRETIAVVNFFSFAFTIAIALFYDYFYLRWSAYKIKLMRNFFCPNALDGRPEIPDAPSVSSGLSGLSEDYFRSLRDAGKPSLLYMLLDSMAVTAALTLISYFAIHLWLQ
ncbi:MAG: hypothetical protein LBC82_01455 [Oscillospiraceae bacterium]|jgi:hypothetical protein|nr:hypothetical protein [Oscillospiraceae bacterium]